MNSESPFTPPRSDQPVVDPTAAEIIASDPNGPQKYPALVFASWTVILAVVIFIAGFVSYAQYIGPRSIEMSGAELIGINLSAKAMVGFRQPTETALQSLKQFESGPLEQRYGHAILVNEFAGPQRALEQLGLIDRAVETEVEKLAVSDDNVEFPSETQIEIRQILGRLFQQYESGDFDSSGLAEQDRELLTSKLGWIGKLALTPGKSPNTLDREQIDNDGSRTFMILAIVTVLGILVILAAFVAIAILIGSFAAGLLHAQLQNNSRHGFVYIETFAIWILLFFVLQIMSGLAGQLFRNDSVAMFLTPTAFFASLVVLCWPLIRGVSVKQMCRDIGWEIRNPFVEVFVGGFSYVALIVPMLFGVSVTILLGVTLSWMNAPGEFESSGPVGHPIAEEIATGGTLAWLAVVLSACVAAPFVEETMFRGVLYRYLRDATDSRRRWISVSLSSLTGGLMFAMIHPQGIVGIPVLTTLALGFSLVREWRNSLIGPIVMHAINNGIVTCLLLLLFS